MKIRLSHLVLLVALPSAVFAGTYASIAKEVEFVSSEETEKPTLQRFSSYDLVWDHSQGKFEARAVISGEPLNMDPLLTEPAEQAPDTHRRELAI